MNAKYLLAAGLLLAGCTKSPRQQAEAAVTAYLKANLNDPGSYEPGTFEVTRYSRADSAQNEAIGVARMIGVNDSAFYAPATSVGTREKLLASKHKLVTREGILYDIHDTTQVGWGVVHRYRARNSYNALVQQQGRFVVYLPATVVVLAK